MEDKKKAYARQNAHIAAHYDRQTITMPKGLKEQIKAAGYSVNGFMLEAIREKLERLERLAEPVEPAQTEKTEKTETNSATPGSIRELAERVKASAQEAAANRAARKTGEEAAGDILAEYKKNNM